MKEITRRSRSNRQFAPHKLIHSNGDRVFVTYAIPENQNDLKRWGKEMVINFENFKVRLDGRAINSIKSVLKQAGEI